MAESEKFTVSGSQLVEKVKQLIHAGNIRRVRLLHEGKEYGLILDYSGVIENLDEAIDFYSQLADI